MERPTIALCCILKDEVNNIERLLDSVDGCFDEIHFTDTGSTDGSIELIQRLQKTRPNIFLHHFEWVNDFSAARNYSFGFATTDYLMWMDLDDVLSDKGAFVHFRDTLMEIAPFWFATYHYVTNEKGEHTCSFMRERVVKRSLGLSWVDFVHEGISAKTKEGEITAAHYATSWSVIHRRSEEDAKKDRSRNLNLFKDKKDLSPRMRYYYGKELFENKKPLEAFQELISAISEESMEIHDRLMGIQYAAMAAMQLTQYDRAIQLAHQGMQLDPKRAEFYVITGDSYVKLNKLVEAIPYYNAATCCPNSQGSKHAGPIHIHADSYGRYPYQQLARIYANLHNFEKAEEYVNLSLSYGENEESRGILAEIKKIKNNVGSNINVPRTKTQDIVISCHPHGFYEWDEEIYKTTGIGGSETAAVEMARHLHRLTGRKVIVFNNRTKNKIIDGVHYVAAAELPMYFAATTPAVNIAWRHNIKMTDAPTYLWCHDLSVMQIDVPHYNKVLALSNFHKDFLVGLCGVQPQNVIVTRNGVDPSRFDEVVKKDPNKLIFSSSPDRGLDRAMLVMDEIVKEIPEARLECFYGFDNMTKLNKGSDVERLKKMISERPYIKYHGNVSQKELTKHMGESSVWLYPTNFLETYCITAVEALCSKVYPVVRRYGALKDTLRAAEAQGMATLIDGEDIQGYAQAAISALREQKWKKVSVENNHFSWESVAREWIDIMGL